MFSRTEALLGKEALDRLWKSHVAVFGIGGVGSYAAETLVRSGLGTISLIDYDIIDISNINRQVHADTESVGRYKVEVMKDRLLKINPNLTVNCHKIKFSKESIEEFSWDYDYLVDAIDTISSKLDLIEEGKSRGIPVISSMGAGNKLDPTAFRLGDISETRVCPLAKVMRRELKKRSIKDVKVVWSEEDPLKINLGDKDKRKAVVASVSFVPPVVGLIIGGELVKDLIGGRHGTKR